MPQTTGRERARAVEALRAQRGMAAAARSLAGLSVMHCKHLLLDRSSSARSLESCGSQPMT